MEHVFFPNSDVWGMGSVLWEMTNPQRYAQHCERLRAARCALPAAPHWWLLLDLVAA